MAALPHHRHAAAIDRFDRPVVGSEHEGIDDGVVKFKIGRGTSEKYDLLWDERSRSLTWIGVANDPTRPTKVQECIVTKPRSIMEIYAELSRWR